MSHDTTTPAAITLDELEQVSGGIITRPIRSLPGTFHILPYPFPNKRPHIYVRPFVRYGVGHG